MQTLIEENLEKFSKIYDTGVILENIEEGFTHILCDPLYFLDDSVDRYQLIFSKYNMAIYMAEGTFIKLLFDDDTTEGDDMIYTDKDYNNFLFSEELKISILDLKMLLEYKD